MRVIVVRVVVRVGEEIDLLETGEVCQKHTQADRGNIAGCRQRQEARQHHSNIAQLQANTG